MMRKYERDKEISLNPAKKKSLLWFEFSSCKKCLTGNRINIRRYLFQISTESFSESILFIGRKTANGFRQFIHLPFRRFGYNVREERVGGDIQGICDGDEVIKPHGWTNSWQNSKYKQRAAARFVQQPFRVGRLEISSAFVIILHSVYSAAGSAPRRGSCQDRCGSALRPAK